MTDYSKLSDDEINKILVESLEKYDKVLVVAKEQKTILEAVREEMLKRIQGVINKGTNLC